MLSAAALTVLIFCGALSGCGGKEGGLNDLLRRLRGLLSSGVVGYKHVLLITVDTLRPDYLSINGHELPTTPTLDSLISEGTYFTHALTPIPRTTQALGSLLTGCYPHTTGLRTLYDSMDPHVVSIAEIARRKGFRTIAVVSNTIVPPERGLGRGFQVYDYAGNIRDAMLTTDAALGRMGACRSDDSLFVWVHYIDPHVPYYPPEAIVDEFDPSYRGRYRYHFGTIPGGVGNQAYPPHLGKKRAVFMNDLPDSVNAHLRKPYAAEVRYTDAAIRKLLHWISNNFGDDWLIVFTADHGESLGEHNYYYDHGDYVYNASLRIPLAFVFPKGDRRAGGRRVDDLVSLIDVMPTLVELLDMDLPDEMDYALEGRSLANFFEGSDLAPRPCFAECGRSFSPTW